jgi:hypothetical protein
MTAPTSDIKKVRRMKKGAIGRSGENTGDWATHDRSNNPDYDRFHEPMS